MDNSNKKIGSIISSSLRRFEWIIKNKYFPHQGKQEKARRRRQMEKGIIRANKWALKPKKPG